MHERSRRRYKKRSDVRKRSSRNTKSYRGSKSNSHSPQGYYVEPLFPNGMNGPAPPPHQGGFQYPVSYSPPHNTYGPGTIGFGGNHYMTPGYAYQSYSYQQPQGFYPEPAGPKTHPVVVEGNGHATHQNTKDMPTNTMPKSLAVTKHHGKSMSTNDPKSVSKDSQSPKLEISPTGVEGPDISVLSESEKKLFTLLDDIMSQKATAIIDAVNDRLSKMHDRLIKIENDVRKNMFKSNTNEEHVGDIDFSVGNMYQSVNANTRGVEVVTKEVNKRIGENLHFSLTWPLQTYLCERFEEDVRMISFRLDRRNHGEHFHRIKSVRACSKYSKLLHVLDQTQIGFKTYTGYKKFSQIFAFNTDALNYDLMAVDQKDRIRSIVKVSSTTLSPVNYNILSFEQLNEGQVSLVKKVCQLERQLSFVKNLDDIEFVGLFVFGKYFDVKMNAFFEHNAGVFPNLQKFYEKKQFFVGKFNHLFKRKVVKY